MNERKILQNSAYGLSVAKTIKSYALDNDTIEAIDRISSDLGIKSRSETLREIVRRYDEWQETHNTQS